ncbi:hypothetical protein [Bradyrhizobium tunisiense]|uniref:hypothetical protein n=1 Tax=Bradyrhizobium tunisiense TaxID=3278709 RepID=UPI0035DFA466
MSVYPWIDANSECAPERITNVLRRPIADGTSTRSRLILIVIDREKRLASLVNQITQTSFKHGPALAIHIRPAAIDRVNKRLIALRRQLRWSY